MLRFLGGLHRLVLSGAAPALAAHFPSSPAPGQPIEGGDADAAFRVIQDLCADPPAEVLDAFARPPQTNEPGRSAALMSGLLAVADVVRMPISLREIGSSAGLNLRLDRYWYEKGGAGWGERDSTVRFVDLWHGGAPPFDAPLELADRRGCDQDPIDATTEDGGLTLLSYLWPEQAERFDRARNAIALAHDEPVTIDRADAAAWVPEQLDARPAGTALAVMHSVMWQYLNTETQTSIRASLHDHGRTATLDAPLAWVRLEPSEEHYVPAELRVTLWDGRDAEGRERLVATTGFHGGDMQWVDDVS